MMPAHRATPPSLMEFDARGLATALERARRARGLSTRALARRAGIAQSYVVALERARTNPRATTPTPTIDVAARLAEALGLELAELMRAGLRRASQHVVLVVEDHQRSPLAHAQRATRDHHHWVWAASSPGSGIPPGAQHRIDLRRDRAGAYDPEAIARSLRHELQSLDGAIDGCNIGIVFAETSAVMATLADPQTIIEFEHRWSPVVTDAARAVGAHAALNICVYELAALRDLADPAAATLDLLRSHDAVWVARGASVAMGEPAARRVLHQLRPTGTSPAAWKCTVEQMVTELNLAA